MRIEENWAVPAHRIDAFFRQQPDVSPAENGFRFGDCQITLTPLPMTEGFFAVHRTLVVMEGAEEPLRQIYRRFFLQFLSAGG